jgi:Xaa-Pro aminopeptidase
MGRPALPQKPIRKHPMEWAGTTAADKLTAIRRRLAAVHADGMLVSALDDIAWTLNLRGGDIECNPVFIAYLLIASRGATLFTECSRVSDEVKEYLNDNGVELRPYNKIGEGLAHYFEYSILMDGNETAALMPRYVPSRTQVIYAPSPIPLMKAVKNEAETAGFRRAMVSDGVAMVRLLKWIKPAVAKGGVTEMGVDDKLTALRSEDPAYVEKSFETIAAYESHGAIVHYEPTADSDVELRPEGLLLLDCGAQYDCGTTDITRTIPLGPVSEEQRLVYTLVLKAHIRLEMAQFPAGANGTQIDAIARSVLWSRGYNYLHGTGHGVGAHLCVHEGPQQIRMEYVPTALKAGMTITDEPGVYLADRFGVRIENVLLIVGGDSTECGNFLRMEPLTLCPIDTTVIDRWLLDDNEVEWLNDYHRRVYEELAPHLADDERQWLAEATATID